MKEPNEVILPPVIVTSLSPSSGPKGMKVTSIRGKHF